MAPPPLRSHNSVPVMSSTTPALHANANASGSKKQRQSYQYSTFTSSDIQSQRLAALQASHKEMQEESDEERRARGGVTGACAAAAGSLSSGVAGLFRALVYRLSLACLPCFEVLQVLNLLPGGARAGGGGGSNGAANGRRASEDVEAGEDRKLNKRARRKGRGLRGAGSRDLGDESLSGSTATLATVGEETSVKETEREADFGLKRMQNHHPPVKHHASLRCASNCPLNEGKNVCLL